MQCKLGEGRVRKKSREREEDPEKKRSKKDDVKEKKKQLRESIKTRQTGHCYLRVVKLDKRKDAVRSRVANEKVDSR